MRNKFKILALGWLGSAATVAHAQNRLCRSGNINTFGPGPDPVCVPAISNVGVMVVVIVMLAVLAGVTWRRARLTS